MTAFDLPFKTHRSAGVPVTAEVKRLIREGDAARDTCNWKDAGRAYHCALERAPHLAHIWVQYGHALKEANDFAGAEAAYRKAIALSPRNSDAYLQLGHLKKLTGDSVSANRNYMTAVRHDTQNADALNELYDMALSQQSGISHETIIEVLESLAIENSSSTAGHLKSDSNRPHTSHGSINAKVRTTGPLAAMQAEPALDGTETSGAVIVYDASDLISYFRNARLPTGIQRVQIEIISNAISNQHPDSVRICCFIEDRDDWLEIPKDNFANLCRLGLSGGDQKAPEWITELSRLHLILSTSYSFDFPEGAFLINLGTSWWLQNYFLYVRKVKLTKSVKYVPFVHDLIPIVIPEHCTKELTQDFISWILGVFNHADFFLVNSETTRSDLLRIGHTLGHALDVDRTLVVKLDADFRKTHRKPAENQRLADWNLDKQPYALFVSTIESRKNHISIFDAWLQLLRTHGPRRTPKLVCVGNRGWLNDVVYARLSSHEGLRRQVVMLSSISDDDLTQLYRECLFTVYPSQYEGWGLPVTESLCHGKIPLISTSSSLPEAGGPFALYFELGSQKQLVKALERLAFNHEDRRAMEARIAQDFHPRTWRDLATQIETQVQFWRETVEPYIPQAPQVQMGAYHPIVRNFETRIWRGMRSAEVFRMGSGWWGPDDWGCWTKARGGELAIGLPSRHAPLRAYFHLHAPPHLPIEYHLEIETMDIVAEGRLRPDQFQWIALNLPAGPKEPSILHVRLRGSAFDLLSEITEGKDRRVVSVGLAGFFICEAADMESRQNFLEAVSLGNIDSLIMRNRYEDYSNEPKLIFETN